jgi:apolipoprotein N-acyltransferase
MTGSSTRPFAAYLPDWKLIAGALIFALPARYSAVWPLALIVYVPWLLTVGAQRSYRRTLVQAAWYALGILIAVYPWVGTGFHTELLLGWPASIVAFLLSTPFFLPQLVLYPLSRRAILALFDRGRLPAWMGVSAACLSYVALDSLSPNLTHGLAGVLLIPNPQLRQLATLGGRSLLGLIPLALGEAICAVYTAPGESRSRRGAWGGLLAVMALLAVSGAWGQREWARTKAAIATTPKLRVALIQPHLTKDLVRTAGRGDEDAIDALIDRYLKLSDLALGTSPRPELVLWPEGAYPRSFLVPQTIREQASVDRIEGFARSRHVQLLFGTRDELGEARFNAAVSIAPDGTTSLYRKTLLAPLAEYLPVFTGSLGKKIADWLVPGGPISPGPGARVLPLAVGPVARSSLNPIICYESLSTGYALEGARMGSGLLVNLSNDSWPGNTVARRLHFESARLRSTETRLAQVSDTTDGVTAVLDSAGEVTAQAPAYESTFLVADVTLGQSGPTLIKSWGDWFGDFSLGVCALLVVCAGLRARRSRAQSGVPSTGVQVFTPLQT